MYPNQNNSQTLSEDEINVACRACLKKNATVNLFKTRFAGGIRLCDLLLLFTDSDIQESDGLPDKVCEKCVCFLEKASLFRETVKSSLITLQSVVNKEPKPEIEYNNVKDLLNDFTDDNNENDPIYDYNYENNENDPIYDYNDENNDLNLYGDTLNSSTQDESLTCSFCKIKFISEDVYKLHIAKETEIRNEKPKSHECPVCDETSANTELRDAHLQLHLEIGQLRCKLCFRVFGDPSRLVRHFKGHGKNMKVCQICHKQFFKSQVFEDHMRKHEGIINFSCSQCDKKFITAANYRSHVSRYHGGTYTCKVCGKIFNSSVNGRRHERGHSQKFLCNECGLQVSTAANLRRHIRVVHKHIKSNLTGPDFACEICGNTYKRKFHLEQHLVSHSDERPFLCAECGKSYKTKYALQNHVDISHGETTDGFFNCTECKRSFLSEARLKKHFQRHENGTFNGKNYLTCPTCGRTFKSVKFFNQHQQYHSKKLPYACELCPKSYVVKGFLEKHMTVHLQGAKPWLPTSTELISCPYCPKQFRHQSNLSNHIKVHGVGLDNRPFKCSMCTKQFKTLKNLTQHEVLHFKSKNDSPSKKLSMPVLDEQNENNYDSSAWGYMSMDMKSEDNKEEYDEYNQSQEEDYSQNLEDGYSS